MSCRYHLVHDRVSKVHKSQRMTEEQVLDWLDNAQHTCALDVADMGPSEASEVARHLGITRPSVDTAIKSAGRVRLSIVGDAFRDAVHAYAEMRDRSETLMGGGPW
jgi:hypothetical protein